ncbi:MAG: SDR family oxidoreductase [Rhizobiaceae bacterium]|nr:SDR family oxidoreductase [Rhizobiaceae bacterium]
MTDAMPTAVVTGAARRIGLAIARDLASHGFTVALHANRSGAEAERAAAQIRADGGTAAVFVADLSDMAAVEGLVARVATQLGPVRLLVNNASLFESDGVEDFRWDVWDRHFDVHVKAPAMLTRQMAATLPPGETGLVVNIIDQRVWKLTPQFFSYTLSKSALWTATLTMAQALAPRIRVNAIGPGPTLASARQDEAAFAAQVAALPLRHGPALDEFGATIRYLWAMDSITGQMIALDGGQHLAWQTTDVTVSNE